MIDLNVFDSSSVGGLFSFYVDTYWSMAQKFIQYNVFLSLMEFSIFLNFFSRKDYSRKLKAESRTAMPTTIFADYNTVYFNLKLYKEITIPFCAAIKFPGCKVN